MARQRTPTDITPPEIRSPGYKRLLAGLDSNPNKAVVRWQRPQTIVKHNRDFYDVQN